MVAGAEGEGYGEGGDDAEGDDGFFHGFLF